MESTPAVEERASLGKETVMDMIMMRKMAGKGGCMLRFMDWVWELEKEEVRRRRSGED